MPKKDISPKQAFDASTRREMKLRELLQSRVDPLLTIITISIAILLFIGFFVTLPTFFIVFVLILLIVIFIMVVWKNTLKLQIKKEVDLQQWLSFEIGPDIKDKETS